MSRHHVALKNDPRYKAWRRTVLDRDDHTCQLCGDPADQADHVVPLAVLIPAGGDPFDVDNGQALCGPCNKRKGNRSVVRQEFRNGNWI